MRIPIILALGAAAAVTAPVTAQPTLDGAPVVYRLNDAANRFQGCFEPCRCPLVIDEEIGGTLVLTLRRDLGTVLEYDVTDVNWWYPSDEGEMHVTGRGQYTRISGIAGWIHRLELSLQVNKGDPIRFDSGLVNGGGDFPALTGLMIGMNNFDCLDSGFTVDASPVPARELTFYRLGSGSGYTEGCLPPCLCPILVTQPLRGSFALVPIADFGTYFEYAVVNMRLRVVSDFTTPSQRFEGVGRYTRIAGFAGWIHRMELSLSIDGDPPTRFDSGGINDGTGYPGIDIAVAMNGFFCYDIVLDLAADPACRCEFDGDLSGVGIQDLLAYLVLWFDEDPETDFDGTPGITVFDLLAYLDCWFPASTGLPCR